MPTLKTNLLRLDISNPHFLYQVEVISKHAIDPPLRQEVATFLAQELPLAIYLAPLLYSPTIISQSQFHVFLSNGNAVFLSLQQLASKQDSKLILTPIAHKLVSLTELLYCHHLDICFNPYEEKANEHAREMPGYSLRAGEGGLHVIPWVMHWEVGSQMGEGAQVLLDYDTGNFFLKQSIVRVDKTRGEVHFRDGVVARWAGLHPVTVKPINGYPLAHELYHFIDRIKQTSKQFAAAWGLKFDSRLLETAYTTVAPGHIAFRNGQEKTLAEIVTPMSEHNYWHSYLNLFGSVTFEDPLQAELVVLVQGEQKKESGELLRSLEDIKSKMGLTLQIKLLFYHSLEKLDDILFIVNKEKAVIQSVPKVFVLLNSHHKTKQEKECFDRLKQYLIDSLLLFHSVQFNHRAKEINWQAVAYKHLAIIYAKFRLNPWKLKNIPFSNNPMVVMSLHVEPTRSGLLSVALISTMNLYLNKFTAVHRLCPPEQLGITLQEAILQCIQKFKSAHSKYPVRIIMFRSGHGAEQDLVEQIHRIRQSIINQAGSLITYVTLCKEHQLRMFNQVDNNYVSKDSIKKVQLLLQTEIRGELFVQLQLEEPMHRIGIHDVEKNDPNFTTKILELLARIVFGSVGNSYGLGLGFIDYSRKMNHYRQFNLQPWKAILKDGILLFL